MITQKAKARQAVVKVANKKVKAMPVKSMG